MSFRGGDPEQILDEPDLAIRLPSLKGHPFAIRMQAQKTDAVHTNPRSARLAVFGGNFRDLGLSAAPLHEHELA